MVSRCLLLAVAALVAALGPVEAANQPPPAFERLESLWGDVNDYTVHIAQHEVLGDQSADNSFHYAFKRPDRARLDVLTGNKSGSTMTIDGGERVTAYMRSLSFFKKHGDARDKDLTSLRGNGIMMGNFGDLISCYAAHRELLRESAGPAVDGQPTDEISLPYAGITCPDDAVSDRGVVTLDVIDTRRSDGLIVERRRYVGTQLVEQWDLTNYTINSGLTDGDLR